MKAILEFNLDDYDDRMAHLRCIKSTDMALVLFDVIYNFRKQIENENPKSELDLLYDKLNVLLDEHGINIDELIR